jgi:hypothetical protein
VEGTTDREGVFRTAWRCAPCAPEYAIEVSATLEGMRPSKTAVNVKIQ